MTQTQTLQKSTFVTVLSWIFIFLAGSATVISIIQNVLINVLFPVEEMIKAFNEPTFNESMPNRFKFYSLMFVCFFLFSNCLSNDICFCNWIIKTQELGKNYIYNAHDLRNIMECVWDNNEFFYVL